MPTNDFLPFGSAVGANVSTQAEYAALAARSNGFSAGTAVSRQLNKAWRQSSVMAATLAQFIADQSGNDVLDDGNLATIQTNLGLAIKAAVASGVPYATQAQVNAGTNSATSVTPQTLAVATRIQAFTAFTTTGSAPAFVLAPVPAITGYALNQSFRITFHAAGGATPTINISTIGAKNVKQYDSSGAKIPAVITANMTSDAFYDGTDIVLLDQLPGSSGTTLGKFDSSTGLATTAMVQSVGLRFNNNIIVNANTALTAAAHAGALIVTNSATPITLTLPSAGSMPGGTTIKFFNYGGGLLSVVANGTDVIQDPFANIPVLSIPSGSYFLLDSTGAAGWYVFDGTMPASEGRYGAVKLALQSQANAGVDDTAAMTAKKTAVVVAAGDAAVLAVAFGVGQTWQDVTGSRVIGTTYTNSTSRPITVSVNSASGATATLSVNGVQVSRAAQSTGGLGYQLSAIVPVGGTYVYNTSAGNLTNWAELK